MSQSATKTMAELLVENTARIANSLDALKAAGLPENLIVLYIQQKTRINKGQIVAVLDALKDFNRQVKIPSPTPQKTP